MSNKDRKVLKDNLFYFSKNVSFNQAKEKNINDFKLNNTANPNDNIKMQIICSFYFLKDIFKQTS